MEKPFEKGQIVGKWLKFMEVEDGRRVKIHSISKSNSVGSGWMVDYIQVNENLEEIGRVYSGYDSEWFFNI